MQHFSKRFWFTAFAGGFSSLLLTAAMLWVFTTQSAEMVTLCGQGKDRCASWESHQHLSRLTSTALAGGTILLFGLAYRLGGRLVKPAADAGR